MTWFDTFKGQWRKGAEMETQEYDPRAFKPVSTQDRVGQELDTIRMVYDSLARLEPAARVRVLRYVEAFLSEES